MTGSNQKPHAAALHDCTRRVSHPDSEEAVQIERQRIAQELKPYKSDASSKYVQQSRSAQGDILSRSRLSSHVGSTASNAPLQTRESIESYATTQPDRPSDSWNWPCPEQHWCSPVVEFWTTHVRYNSQHLSFPSVLILQSHNRRGGIQRSSG